MARLIVCCLFAASVVASNRATSEHLQETVGTATQFTVFFRATPIGKEQVSLSTSGDERIIEGSGRLGPPLDVVVQRFDARYDLNWKPRQLTLTGSNRGEPVTLRTAFAGDLATTEITQGGKPSQKSDAVSPDAIILPNGFFGAHEALAARLKNAEPGTELRAYVLPQAEIVVRVRSVSHEKVQTTAASIPTRRYDLEFMNPSGPLPVQVWTDETGRLLRLTVPSQALDVVRDDVAAVSSRHESISRPGDEQVRVPASGFSLAATISKPNLGQAMPRPRSPAVVLVSGSGPVDRDETAAGIPIFGQLAGALADDGFLVLRYDKRGVGQSGGRWETSSVNDYAEDVRTVVRFLAKRKDVDSKRIALVGHSEGGWVALSAAVKNKHVAALVLIGTPGIPGADLILEQQRNALERLQIPEAEKRYKIDLQKAIHHAVVTGQGWDEVPPELRRQADTPWFRSVIQFDPAQVAVQTRVPALIVHGELDRQVLPYHSERLWQLLQKRKVRLPLEVVRIPGVNHLLVPARTGEVDEYATLTDRQVAPAVREPLLNWLRRTFGLEINTGLIGRQSLVASLLKSSRSITNSSRPILRRSPQTIVAEAMRRPLRNVPFVLCRS